MKKKTIKVIVCLCMSLVMLIPPMLTQAATPTEPYTHVEGLDGGKQTVYSRDVYAAIRQIDASSLGTEKLSGITDLHCTADGNIYLLCGDSSRLLMLNSQYELVQEINVRYQTGKNCNYSGAMGVFVNEEGTIFIADSMNNRVLIVDAEGYVTDELGVPEADVIPEDFYFQPTRVLEDDQGYLYVLSLGCYFGCLLYSADHEFLGFYGSNEVQGTVLDTLSYLWELLTSNDTKKAKQVKTLPYTAIDIAIDQEGYVYTCNGSGSYKSQGSGQIRKISPGGSNILNRRESDGTAGSTSSFNFFETKVVVHKRVPRGQEPVALDVSNLNNMYLLDKTYGKVYMYDRDCNLVTVFGGGLGEGTQLGTFMTPVALAVNGNDLLVADSKTCSLTLFELTDFGKTLMQAQSLYFESQYIEAKPYWEQVLEQDGNSRLAYRGLAKSYYAEGKLDLALEYAQIGKDYVIYDYAHQEQITQFVRNNFVVLFLALIMAIIGIVVLLIKIGKRTEPLIRNEKLHCFVSTLAHPYQAFADIKYRKLGSMKIAVTVTICLFLSATLKNTCCGFLFRKSDAQSYNVLFTLAQTIGLIVLWSVANWAICTVAEGKGRMKEVYIVSSYATLPIIIYNVIYVLLSQVANLESVDVIISLNMLALLYAFFILCVGIMAIQEYNFPKFLFTSFVAVLIMILVVFIGFMIVILLQQFWNFLYSLYMEVMYR